MKKKSKHVKKNQKSWLYSRILIIDKLQKNNFEKNWDHFKYSRFDQTNENFDEFVNYANFYTYDINIFHQIVSDEIDFFVYLNWDFHIFYNDYTWLLSINSFLNVALIEVFVFENYFEFAILCDLKSYSFFFC